jgi:hypothetical protein
VGNRICCRSSKGGINIILFVFLLIVTLLSLILMIWAFYHKILSVGVEWTILLVSSVCALISCSISREYEVKATGTLQTSEGKVQVYILEKEDTTYVVEKEPDMHWNRKDTIELSGFEFSELHVLSKYKATLENISIQN